MPKKCAIALRLTSANQETQLSMPSDAPSPPTITVGQHVLANRAILAPMSGVSDLPFRALAHEFGAGLVVSEMVASRELVNARADVVRKAEGGAMRPFCVQLVGCEPEWMAEGARVLEASGVDIIDINMGCPAREVTGKLSGSALMRDLDHAERLIEAVVGAVSVPVTLKMRLGWDERSINAPELARRAERLGVQMLTVHGRTRQQFFKGHADWSKVRAVVDAVTIPVVVNGDIRSIADAETALALSGARGVMIGRGAYGAPMRVGEIGRALDGKRTDQPIDLGALAVRHVSEMLHFYGRTLGLKNAKKHIGWYLETAGHDGQALKAWRQRLCADDDADRVLGLLPHALHRSAPSLEVAA
jgi:tRNA-dihydrouridine synthase B